MAWGRPGDKPLSQPMMVSLLTHIYTYIYIYVCATRPHWVKMLRFEQEGRPFADAVFKLIFLNENYYVLSHIFLKFVPKGSVYNEPAFATTYYLNQWWPNSLSTTQASPGPWFNIKLFYRRRKSHCGDKTILRPSYLHNGISYTGKTASLYWIGAQATTS